MVTDEQHRMLLTWWHRFIFRADSAAYIGLPAGGWEAERVEWVPLNDIPRLVGKGDIMSGTGMATLLYVLTEL
ncbi:hypothetical protein [Streptosporangium sp. NPDC087985]|uniref:hypothetical protein n=1 Tax=Streptosporangium sp. NPDC087985 TaxID=3366196 RepID=UPI00380E3E85